MKGIGIATANQNIFCGNVTQISTRSLKSHSHFLWSGFTAP